MTDITGLLKKTHREVGRRRIAAGEARTALMRRRYDAPIEDVWDACTDPDRISRWFIKPTGDLRPGGTFSLEGNASGEILHCEPPRLLTVTWSYPGRPVDQLELRLSPGEDGGTVLELEHASVADVFITNDPETGTWGIGPGWEAPLDYLAKYLRGELPDVPAAEWWEPTPEDEELGNRRGHAWAAVIESALTVGHAKGGGLNSEPEENGRGAQERGVARILDISDLPHGETSHVFEGHHHGDTNVSFFLVDAPPESGPRLHRHPYEEIFVVQEGSATFTAEDDVVEARGGQIVVVPAGVPHKFVNSGADRLRQVNIHASKRFITEWLED